MTIRKCDFVVHSTGTGVDAACCGKESMSYCDKCECELCETHCAWCDPCEKHFCLDCFPDHPCPLAELAEQAFRAMSAERLAGIVRTLALAELHDEPSFIEKQLARQQ